MSSLEFREQALNSQRRIDTLPSTMRVTTGVTRAAMGLLAVMLGGAVVWSAFVEVPVQINGTGVFVDTSGELLNAVRAPMDGVVEAILVNEGDYVSQGQIVATLRLPDRLAALQQAERNLASLRERSTQRRALEEAETKPGFELAKLLGQAGLGCVDALGGERDVEPGVDDGEYGAELGQGHDVVPGDRKGWCRLLASRRYQFALVKPQPPT
jgi:hypothetical protein